MKPRYNTPDITIRLLPQRINIPIALSTEILRSRPGSYFMALHFKIEFSIPLFLLYIYFFMPKYQAIFEGIRPFFERKWRATDKDGLAHQ